VETGAASGLLRARSIGVQRRSASLSGYARQTSTQTLGPHVGESRTRFSRTHMSDVTTIKEYFGIPSRKVNLIYDVVPRRTNSHRAGAVFAYISHITYSGTTCR